MEKRETMRILSILGFGFGSSINANNTDLVQQVEPSLADGVSVSGAAGANARGSWTQVDAATSTTKTAIIVGIVVVAITGLHEVQLGIGGSGSEVAIANVMATAVGYLPIAPKFVSPGTRISARTASVAGGSQAIKIKYVYHNVSTI